MKRTLFAIAAILSFPTAAFAVCGPTPMGDFNNASTNFKTALDGSSNCFGFVGLIDSTGANAFPSVAALADATANPTDLLLGSLNFGFNGTTWDRLRTVGTGVLKTDMSSVNGTATVTAGVNGTQAFGGNQATNNNVSTNVNPVLVAGSDYGGTPKIQSIKSDSSGFLHVIAEAASNIFGKVGIDQTTPGTTNAVQAIAGSTGGASVFRKIVTNNTTSFAVDANPGTLYAISAFSISNTAPAFVKLFNTAQGSVTCGTTTPFDGPMIIPANQTQGAGYIWSVPVGAAYSTAITACVTGGIADSDTTAPAANTYEVSFYYK